MSELEERLLRGEGGDLWRAALIASGVTAQSEMDLYLSRLDQLWRSIPAGVFAPRSKLEMAQGLLQWLWQRKPSRYHSGGNFKLTEVLEAELDTSSHAIGNCLGLTLLYNVMLERLGLKPWAVHLDHAFGIGPHVFTTLHFEGHSIDIENIFPHGFDYKGHLNHPQRKEWGTEELAADIYASRGNQYFEMGELEAAVDPYEKAIALNPAHPTATRNRTMAQAELGKDENSPEESQP